MDKCWAKLDGLHSLLVPHRIAPHYITPTYLLRQCVIECINNSEYRGVVYPEGCKLGNVETQLCTCGIILYLPFHTTYILLPYTFCIISLHLPYNCRTHHPPAPQKKVTVLSTCLQFVYIS